jgi:hypothetical protein
MATATKPRSFDEVLSILGSEKFDVAPLGEGASRGTGGNRVSKYGVAAEIAPANAKDATVQVLARPGWLLGGEIARLTDRGYQKFLKTKRLEIPATADILRAIHLFSEELKEATGGLQLYNESLGTTSDAYVYDRVKGRE